MCGISGVIGHRDAGLIKRMNAALYHRGPDSEGYFSSVDVDLGMRRLSIIDLVSGDQPIFNEAGDKCIVFNGEIYNYRELRRELSEKGHTFRTTTDTEVIIHLYEEYGVACVERLRGMFAFAIADGERLFIARDRLGIKPLYYAHVGARGLLIFASEIKALLQCPALRVAVNRQALGNRLVLGYACGDETYFEGVKSLLPGHYMLIERRGEEISVRREKYFQVAIAPDMTLTLEKSEQELTAILRGSVRSHLVADVGVGLALSGGIDSSLLACAMKEFYPDTISTFTISDTSLNADVRQSRKLAQHLGSRHDEILMDYSDYLSEIPSCMLAEEQPPSLFALPFFHLCKIIGGQVKVCLNGEGADELFGGYPEYLNRAGKLANLRSGLQRAQAFGLAVADEALAAADGLLSAATPDEYLEKLFAHNLRDQLVRFHLDIIDKYSMAASLEIRVPFLDNQMIDFANSLPLNFKVNRELGLGKHILKSVAVKTFGHVLLDAAMRRKIGFPSSGLQYYSRFSELCEINLPDEYAEKHEMSPYYPSSGEGVGRASSKRDLLLFDLFSFIFIEQRGVVPQEFDINDFIKQKAARLVLVEN